MRRDHTDVFWKNTIVFDKDNDLSVGPLAQAMAAVYYLAHIHNIDAFWTNPMIETDGDDGTYYYVEINEEVKDIIIAIMRSFECDIEIESITTGTSKTGELIEVDCLHYTCQFGEEYVDKFFPSARNRLNIRGWLTSMFESRNMDVSLISKTFPIQDV